jgi:hypothetical protein
MRDHRLNSLGQIITAAEKSDHERYFFSPQTLDAWSSVISGMVYPTFGEYGTLFVSSERNGGTSEFEYQRTYTVRRAFWEKRKDGTDNLSIENVSEFQEYVTQVGAHDYAKRIRLEHMSPRDEE